MSPITKTLFGVDDLPDNLGMSQPFLSWPHVVLHNAVDWVIHNGAGCMTVECPTFAKDLHGRKSWTDRPVGSAWGGVNVLKEIDSRQERSSSIEVHPSLVSKRILTRARPSLEPVGLRAQLPGMRALISSGASCSLQSAQPWLSLWAKSYL